MCFWYRHVKAIEGDRYEAIKPTLIDKLRRAVNAESLHGLTIVQFGKSAMTDKRGCQVIGDSLLRGEVARTLPGNYGGNFFVGDAALLRQHHVSVDFIGSSEFGTGDKDGYFSNWFRKRRREGERFRQLPDRFSELRLMQPWIPRPHKRAIFGDAAESLETLLYATSHVFINRALLGGKIGWRNQR